MIEKEELGHIMKFIAEYWEKLEKEPDNDAFKILPSKFWMKSLGGPVGNEKGSKGRWVTTLMYQKMKKWKKHFVKC